MKITKAKDKIISKPREEREYKPKSLLPDAFYTSSRKGYGWCNGCGDYSINVLNDLGLTCREGHTTTLLKDYTIPSKKILVRKRKEDKAQDRLTQDLLLL